MPTDFYVRCPACAGKPEGSRYRCPGCGGVAFVKADGESERLQADNARLRLALSSIKEQAKNKGPDHWVDQLYWIWKEARNALETNNL
jgi:hypothetical protein